MRRNFAILLVLVTILPGWLAAQPAINLLRNGDFSERGNGGVPAGWNVGRDSQPWKLEPAVESTGNKPTLTVTIARAQANYGAVEQSVKGLSKNTRYLAEARVKAGGKEMALLMVKLLDPSGKEIRRIGGGLNAGTDWETLRLAFNSEEATAVSVQCRYLQGQAQVGARVSFAEVKLCEPKAVVPQRTELYVTPAGRSGAAGTTAEPLARIQEALDRATPGTTVHLAPGVYRERVHFNEGGAVNFPVTLEGDPGAVIDASDPVALDWKPADDVGPGVYKAALAAPVITVTVDDKIVTILDERRVDPENVKKVLARGRNRQALGVVPENVYTPDWAWPIIFQKGIGP